MKKAKIKKNTAKAKGSYTGCNVKVSAGWMIFIDVKEGVRKGLYVANLDSMKLEKL